VIKRARRLVKRIAFWFARTYVETHPAPHRWSGWPGAWCLDCGAEDQRELCIATHNVLLQCVEGHVAGDGHPDAVCTVHVNGPCPCPGEGRADPYRR